MAPSESRRWLHIMSLQNLLTITRHLTVFPGLGERIHHCQDQVSPGFRGGLRRRRIEQHPDVRLEMLENEYFQ